MSKRQPLFVHHLAGLEKAYVGSALREAAMSAVRPGVARNPMPGAEWQVVPACFRPDPAIWHSADPLPDIFQGRRRDD
jgi:hypothetical protein